MLLLILLVLLEARARVIVVSPATAGWEDALEGRLVAGLAEPPLGPGDTLLMEDGVYTTQDTISGAWQGSATGGRVTIAARNPGGATLTRPDAASPVLEVASGATLFDVRNLRLLGGSVGLQLGNGNPGEVTEARFSDLVISGAMSHGVLAAAPDKAYDGVVFTGLEVYSVGGACFFLGDEPTSTFSGGVVEYSLCHHAQRGVRLDVNSADNRVRYNVFHSLIDAIVALDSGVDNARNTISANLVLNCTSDAITVGRGHNVRDNLVISATNAGITVSGLITTDVDVTFNTVMNAGTGISLLLAAPFDIDVANNVVIAATQGIESLQPMNVTWGPNGVVEGVASNVSMAITLTPPVIDAITGYPLAGSDVIGAGQSEQQATVSYSPRDFSCNARPLMTQMSDLGAHVFGGPTAPVVAAVKRPRLPAPCVGVQLPPIDTATAAPTAMPTQPLTHTFVVDCSGGRCASNLDYFIDNSPDPVLTLVKGQRYAFELTELANHPFAIHMTQAGNVDTELRFNTGVTTNGLTAGTIFFDVPLSAPPLLYYQCEAPSCASMTGPINIVDAQGQTGPITDPIPNPTTAAPGPCTIDGLPTSVGVRLRIFVSYTNYDTFPCSFYGDNLARMLNFERSRILFANAARAPDSVIVLDLVFARGTGAQISADAAYAALVNLVRVGDDAIPNLGATVLRVENSAGAVDAVFPQAQQPMWWIAVAFGAFVLVIVLIVLIVYCCRRAKRKFVSPLAGNKMYSMEGGREALLGDSFEDDVLRPGNRGVQGHSGIESSSSVSPRQPVMPGSFRVKVLYDIKDTGENILSAARQGMHAEILESDWEAKTEWVWATVHDLNQTGWLPVSFVQRIQ